VSGGKAAQVLVVAVVWGPHCGHMHILHCLLLPRQGQISLCKPPAYLAVAQLVRDTLAHVCVGRWGGSSGQQVAANWATGPGSAGGGSVQRAVKQALIGDGGSSNSRSGGSRDGSRDGQEDGTWRMAAGMVRRMDMGWGVGDIGQ